MYKYMYISMYIYMKYMTHTYTHHDGSSGRTALSTSPTFSDVWTFGFLAHSVQTEAPQVMLQSVEVLSDWYVRFEPSRQSQSLSFPPLQVLRCGRCSLDEVRETGAVPYYLDLIGSQRRLTSGGSEGKERVKNPQLL